jgi:capsular polysaccharide biosynthesis protein
MQRAFTGEAVLEKKGYPLWISRMDAPDKKLRNEKDLIGCVADLFGGVRVIELSKYSMEQQTRLFAEARFIFGPLGQGVANILYSRESVLIILAAGSEGKPVGASLMTGAAGAIVGNRALCLNSGTTYQGKRREWIYPIEKFQSELRTLVEQVKKISGGIESF